MANYVISSMASGRQMFAAETPTGWTENPEAAEVIDEECDSISAHKMHAQGRLIQMGLEPRVCVIPAHLMRRKESEIH